MSSAGSREEMMEELQRMRRTMARAAPDPPETFSPNADAIAFSPNTSTTTNTNAAAPSSASASAAPSAARDNRGHFIDTWCRKIELFVADPTKTAMELPRDLPANDRRELHALAERFNLSHQSRGAGAERRLVLKKDALHYRMPDARPADVEALRQPTPRAGEKLSKFHIRRTRADPDAAIGSVGAFGDAETAQMVRRLDRATDEYRRAVEIGYTQEELLAIEAGDTVEATLRRPHADAASADVLCVKEKGEGEEQEEKGQAQKMKLLEQQRSDGAQRLVAKGPVAYDEMCLRCGTRARVEYDVSKWRCNGQCSVCAQQTVWKLVEVVDDRKRVRDAEIQQQKQPQALPAPPEEIDKNNDEDDTVTVEDVVDMASMNDFCAADVNWVRRFATHHQPPGSRQVLNEHIVFCIDFADLPSMRIFRVEHVNADAKSEAKRARHEEVEEWFLWLCEVRDAGIPLSALLEEVATGRYDAVAVAFPNMSVYGSAAVCICRVRVPQGSGDEAWTALQRKYGAKHVRFSRVFEDVLRGEAESAPGELR